MEHHDSDSSPVSSDSPAPHFPISRRVGAFSDPGGSAVDREEGEAKARGSRGLGVPVYVANVGEGSSGTKRTIWSSDECVALAKAWISVVEDPYVGANQHIDRIWWRISQSYIQFKPPTGKPHNSEQCRKQWDRLKMPLSRFVSIYTNNLRSATNGMSAEDVKLLSQQMFPDPEKRLGEFKYWDVYLAVHDSPKFTAGVESGWPKWTRISASREYSSSAGSAELSPARQSSPLPHRRPAAVA
ncbi:uncharacterized protein LOC121790795 [Salvia splendens]|uniref:uncharacterized protein LOC121790795 n=1 Tax=Salvia splendens TaxID=180675 RepID=UPI001C27B6DC|nr:uncharacterized protein LOC121790795 [Salvia splendens]